MIKFINSLRSLIPFSNWSPMYKTCQIDPCSFALVSFGSLRQSGWMKADMTTYITFYYFLNDTMSNNRQ